MSSDVVQCGFSIYLKFNATFKFKNYFISITQHIYVNFTSVLK